MPAPAPAPVNPGTHGKEGILALKMNTGDPWTPIGLVSDYTLSMAKDRVETSGLGSPNKTYVLGLKDISGNITAFADRLSDILFDASDTDLGCYLGIWPYGALSAQGWEGPAHLDASIKGGITSAVTIDATFVANGAWSRTSMVAATGANGVSSPGAFTPAGAMPPANLAGMSAIVANPATPWPAGTYVRLGDGSTAHWNGTAWVAGVA
jgi:hypothetical protein